jgi:hypothetical protein
MIDLARDVLDKQLVDREGRKMGRADGIVLVPRRGRPPLVASIEIGLPVLAGRVRASWREVVERWGARFGVTKRQHLRIDFAHVEDVGIDVDLDVDARVTGALAWEVWLREHAVRRIPGGDSK